MKSLFFNQLVVSGVLLASSLATADRFSWQPEVSLAGKGCKSSNVVQLFDQTQVLVSLNDLENADGAGSQACNVAIPVRVPPDFKLVIDRIEGVADFSVGANSFATWNTETFYTGIRGIKQKESAKGGRFGRSGQFDFNAPVNISTNCGDSVIVRVSTSQMAHGQNLTQVTDSYLSLSYHLEACGQ